ncbi:hypothetical protein MVEN_00680800 [Mycena venus]|uniref:Uncharacterized protein n=1 Tax=Mycena venus TaxID=2733690 RepID=A0A8H6YJ71_9AGAR|nr:hypothetical protein MVEN_00680800 [Mycena venus]
MLQLSNGVPIVPGNLASEANFLDLHGALYGRKIPYTDRIFTVITVYGRLAQSAGPGILAALGATRARRLNLDLKGLLKGMDPQSLHPMFTFVTHLDLFDSLHRGPHVAHLIDHLSLFPALTHLAFFQGNREATQVSSRCRKLEALIGFYTLLPDPRHLRSIDDSRFVTMNVSEDDYVMEWVISTRGGWDFWARADAFIQKRIKGEIEPSWRCWIKEGDGI